MRNGRRNFTSSCRAILAWGSVFYLVLQLALGIMTDHWLPALRDPEYGYKLSLLRTRLAEQPGRELIVILGSSRAGYGFRPEEVPAWQMPGEEPPLLFNFAMTGSGPMMELLCLHRLLAAGIRPNRVIIEVLPPNLHQEGTWAELNWLSISRLGWEDMQLVSRFAERPRQLWFDWWRARTAPAFTQRFCIMSRYAPGWLHWGMRQDIWLGLDRTGWMIYPNTILDAAQQYRALEFARQQYAVPLAHFRITAVADGALRELLELCRQRQIAALLLLMPEGTEFQSWYTPAARAEIDRYLACLSRGYDVPLVDARSWLPDTAFFDSHHLHPDGATAFTQRLAREVFKPSPSWRLATGG
jgi:hypothetical protein